MIIWYCEGKWLCRSKFGDTRLTARAKQIGDRLRHKYGQPNNEGV